MKRGILLVLLVSAVAIGAFLLGRTTSTPSQPTDQTEGRTGAAPRPSPTSTAVVAPQVHRSILRYFAAIDEQNLPEQGVLGGKMIPTTIAFPKDFSRRPGNHFFVVGDDGHILETWTYEIRGRTGWRHTETHDGLEPVDFQRHLEDYDVYLWRPAFYVPAEQD